MCLHAARKPGTSYLSSLPLKDQMSESWLQSHWGFLFIHKEDFLSVRVLITERGSPERSLGPSNFGAGPVCRAGGGRLRGHQTPALPSSLQVDGEERAMLLQDSDVVAGGFSLSPHEGQRLECCWDVLATSSVTPSVATVVNWRC